LKILYFCPQRVWPLTGGALLRNFHLANALAARCQVTLLQLTQTADKADTRWPPTHFRNILTFERGTAYTPLKILNGLLGPMPLPVLNYASDNVSAKLAALLAEQSFDAVQLESVHLLSYLDVILRTPRSPAVVSDWHNVESELMARYAARTGNWGKRVVAYRTAHLLERSEQRLLSKAAAHLVVSEREKQLLKRRSPEAEIYVVPNGVDTAAFGITAQQRSASTRRRNTLLYVGSMDYHANVDAVVWFVREIWPVVASEFPDLGFTIVGRNPGPQVRALASHNVHVTGSVDDVRPSYLSGEAIVVPLRVGSGTRLKILEAMAAGVPVVSTALGAEGLDAIDGVHLLIGNSPGEFASALVRLLRDPALAARLVDAGKKLVTERYDWSTFGQRLYEIHSEVYARTHLPEPR
jgi:sugar transferase (PEP-CTERM/EpsH1 system associated)